MVNPGSEQRDLISSPVAGVEPSSPESGASGDDGQVAVQTPRSEMPVGKSPWMGALVPAAAYSPPLEPMSAVAGPSGAPALDLSSFVSALRRRWLLALCLGVLLGGPIGVAVWFFLPQKYTVQTLIYVAANKPSILGSSSDRLDFMNYQKDQLALIKTHLVLSSAIRDPEVSQLVMIKTLPEDQQISWLQKEVVADFSTSPQILRIAMTGQNTAELVVLVNAVRKAYIREIVDRERDKQLGENKRLDRVYAEYTEQLKKTRLSLREAKLSVGSGDPQTLAFAQQYKLQQIANAQNLLIGAIADLRKMKIGFNSLQDKAKGADAFKVPEELLDQKLKSEPGYGQKMADTLRLEKKVDSLKNQVLDPKNDPAVLRALKDLEAAKRRFDNYVASVRPKFEDQLREQIRRQQKDAATAQDAQIRVMEKYCTELEKDIEKLQDEYKKLNKGVIDVEEGRSDLADKEKLASILGEKKSRVDLEEKYPSERVSLLEEAKTAGAKEESRRIKISGMAGLGAFALAVFGVSFWELRSRRIGTVEEVKQGLGMRLMGTMPAIQKSKNNTASSTSEDAYGQDLVIESIDAMRTMLLHVAKTDSLRSVMVTSAQGGEGKTSLSCHLSASLARSGCRTLLIDGDLRRPSVHRMFGLSLERGLSELLRGEASVEEVVQATQLDDLWVISAGQCDLRSLQALTQHGTSVFNQLKEQFDFIVVDSAPILPVADSLLIGQHVDGVIFSVLRDVSRLPSVYAAYEKINMLGIRVLGAVLNGVRQGSYSTYRYVATKESN